MARRSAEEKVRAKLEALGYRVLHLYPVAGYWRSQDVLRWEAEAVSNDNPLSMLTYRLESWNTLSECARKPLVLTPDQRDPLCLMVSVRESEG